MASLKDLIVLGPARFLDKLYGNLEGNATSADKLKTARSITLTGTVNGTAAFDGSSNIAITTSLAKNYAGSSSDGGVANNSNFLNRKAYLTTAEEMDNFLDATGMQYACFKLTEDSGIGFASNDGMLLSLPWINTTYGAQIAFDDARAGTVAVRGKSTSWGSWYKFLHSGNYTDYTVTKTGSGASGNWEINITGSAAKLTTARSINGTSFDGSGNITTANWGTARNITIGNKTKAINGSTDYNYTHLDIGLQDGYFRNVTRDFTNGTLIQTSIDYSNTNGAPWSLEIKGNSYGSYYPFLLQYQGYIYNNTIIHHGGNMYGYTITGLVAFNYNGKLCFWFPRQDYWQGFAVLVVEEWNDNAKTNTVTNISNSVKPSGITKEIALDNFHYYLHHSNYSSYLDSRYVTLSTSQTITASKIITSNWYFKTTNCTSTPIQIFDDSTTYGHTMLVGAGGTTYIGAGEASGTLYSTLGTKSTENLILGADSLIQFYPGAESATSTSGITLDSSKQFFPQTNNTGSIGTSGYKWNAMYATTFYGALSGNATTATAIQTAGTTAQFYRGDNTWSNTIKQTANAQLGIDTDLKIGTARKDLNFDITNGAGSGINDGYAGGITWGSGNAAYAGIYYQTSGNYGSRLLFGTTGSYANGSYARMIITSSGYVGIGTLSPSQKLAVEGNIYASSKVSSPVIEGTTRGQFGGTSTTSYALNTSSFICDSWVRTKGDTGWYNETHGGGWYMTDTAYIRAYSNKKVYVSNDSMNAVYTLGAMRATKGFTVDESMTVYPSNSNELNFGGSNNSSTIYLGYRAVDSKPIPTKFIFGSITGTAHLQANTVYLGSGTSSYVSSSQYTGNAATATAFSTNRTIALTGDVTGSASTNGSSGWSISTTVADNSHNHSYLSGWPDTRSATTTPNDYNGALKVVGIKTATGSGTLDGSGYSTLVGIRGWGDDSGGNSHELAFTGNGGLYRRHGATTTWSSWLNILDSGNYTSYTVTKTGTGASGTWGISITGSADKIISDKKHAVSSAYSSGKGHRLYLRQYVNVSSSSTSSTDCNYFETYNLPTPTPQNTGNRNYNILTSKSNVTVSQGGTGADTGGASSGQALYNLGLVYSATEPASPTTGMVWLKPA